MMTPQHERWSEFVQRLEGPEGCNFRIEGGGPVWSCAGGNQKPNAIKILASMGFNKTDIQESLAYFESRGGYCDCEILLNVAGED